MSWTVIKKNKKNKPLHKSWCQHNIIKECWISKSVKTKRILSEHRIILNDLKQVSTHKNIILDNILSTIKCICNKDIINNKYYICPDNKFMIIIKQINDNTITLEQWTCHYDKIMQLTPIAVRKVVLYV